MKTSFRSHFCKWSSLTILFVLASSLGLPAQSKMMAAANSAGPVRDLNLSLADALRVASETDKDLAGVHTENARLGWVAFWRKGSHKQESEIAASLRRNLSTAVPVLVRDTQNSRGSLSTTFKLYNDLSVVCQSLDSLVASGSHRNKDEFAALANDLSDMGRVRQELATYIQQTAASLESRNPERVQAFVTANGVKKIIVDDNVPERRTARRQTASRQK